MRRWPCWRAVPGDSSGGSNGRAGRRSTCSSTARVTIGTVPVFIGLNYFGNHAVDPDPAIRLSTRWMRASEANGIVDHRATEASRGTTAAALADRPRHRAGLRGHDRVLRRSRARRSRRGASGHRAARRWAAGSHSRRRSGGVPSACGPGGCRRCVTLPSACPASTLVARSSIGHSRLGKAALWAGVAGRAIRDGRLQRLRRGGAALSRRIYGETIGRITTSFPHWFCRTLSTYDGRESATARRPAPVAGAGRAACAARRQRDRRPLGGSARRVPGDAGRRRGLALARRPRLGVTEHASPWTQPVGARVRYHVRTGGHDITRYDWEQYLETAKTELR